MNALVIFNPAAGQGRPEDALTLLQDKFKGLVGELVVTGGPGDAARAARRAASDPSRFDAVLVAGGDGTINEVINGLLQDSPDRVSPLPLGLIPMGTQNVLAQELKLPMGDLEALASVFRAQKTKVIDLGIASDRYFALMAGFGFDAAVVGEVVRPIKELIGPGAYAFATIGALAKYRSTSVHLVLDGETILFEAYLLIVANIASYAFQQLKLAPFAMLDDGWLDICVFERAPGDKVGFVTQMMAALARRHLRHPRVRYYRARKIEITSTPSIQGQLDGDMFEHTPLKIEVVPKALPVLIP